MRSVPARITLAVLLGTPLPAIAHTGGHLDVDGCHADHRDDTYHCHRGEAAGYTFPDKAAMQEAVRTGDFPDKTVDSEGFFSKLWPFGNKHEQEEAPEQVEGEEGADPANVSATPSTAAAALTPEQEDTAQQLKVARGLYEMGLITKEEYEAKRQAILAEP